jgi:protein-L-isoaspartate(D-aspartate) O-methyltransferase
MIRNARAGHLAKPGTAKFLTPNGRFDRPFNMMKEPLKFQRLREEMVRRQIESRGITDPKVLAAMRKVPRHRFVSEALMDQAYGDFPLPIGEDQTISQPFIVAEMTQALQLSEEDRVLEIGTGSGYQAAILAEIAFRVYTIERIHALLVRARKLFDTLRYHNIVIRYSDGTKGWKAESPFDAIIVTAGAPQIPEVLVSQLAMGGRMVIPVGDQYSQALTKLYRDERGIHKTTLGGCRFVKLMGEHGWREY